MLCTYLLLFNCQGSIAFVYLSKALLLYHIWLRLSIPFSEFFYFFFPRSLACDRRRLHSNSFIIPHSSPFVNTFFKSFLGFFQKVLLSRDLAVFISSPCFLDDPLIISPFSLFVNTVWGDFFFLSLLTVLLLQSPTLCEILQYKGDNVRAGCKKRRAVAPRYTY